MLLSVRSTRSTSDLALTPDRPSDEDHITVATNGTVPEGSFYFPSMAAFSFSA